MRPTARRRKAPESGARALAAGPRAAHGAHSDQQPIQVAAAPAPDQIDPDVQRGRDPPYSGQGQVLAVAALDQRQGGVRDAGSLGYVLLAQPVSQPNRPYDGAESLVCHAATVARAASPAIIAGFTAPRTTTPCRR